MDTIWESMNIASRISKQIEGTDSLVPRSQASVVTPVQDLQELVATINGVRSTLVPFVTSSKKGKVITDTGFDICIKGIKDTLGELLSFFKDLEREFAVNTWKTTKVKLYQMDFLIKQKLDNFAALYNPEETQVISALLGTSTSTSNTPSSLTSTPLSSSPNTSATSSPKPEHHNQNQFSSKVVSGPHMIVDLEGRDLWIKSFGETTLMVPWIVFVNTIESHFGINFKEDEEFVKMILNFTRTNHVSVYEFAVFLKWFGPLKGSFERMLESMKGGLLCGFIPAVEANLLLEGKREGTFLIRCSKTQPGSFAVTFVDNLGKVRHCLLYSVLPCGLTLKNPPTVYGSLKEFAEGHTNKLKHPLGNKWTFKMKLPDFSYGQASESLTPRTTPTTGLQKELNGTGSSLDVNQCIVCMDAPLETVFLECGHLACCAKCSEKLKLCPICRNPITRIIPIFRAT